MELIWLAAGIIIGIPLGMSWQWRRNKPYIRRLEDMRNDAHHEMVEQKWCSEAYIARLEATCEALADALTSPDDDPDDEFDQDDPEYVAGVEAVLRGWAEADAREAAGE